jgi:hypothetical protein
MALATLSAGVDVLLDMSEPVNVVNHLCNCVATGRLDAAIVENAFERVRSLKASVFANAAPCDAERGAIRQHSARLAERVARGAIEIVSAGRPALPLNRERPLAVILLKPFETPFEPPEQPLAAALRERFQNVSYIQLGSKSDAAAYTSAAEIVCEASQLVVAFIVRPAAWHAFGLRPEQREFVDATLSQRDDVVLASLGVPYALQDFPEAAVQICTYSDVPASQAALAEFLLLRRCVHL